RRPMPAQASQRRKASTRPSKCSGAAAARGRSPSPSPRRTSPHRPRSPRRGVNSARRRQRLRPRANDMRRSVADAVVCRAGIAGGAPASFRSAVKGMGDVETVDPHAPLSQPSSRSGENYRSWWPQPTMARLTSRSITLMEDLARASGNMFRMHRRGYLYTTFDGAARARLPARLGAYDHAKLGGIRVHDDGGAGAPYRPGAPTLDEPVDGADLLLGPELIRAAFPQLGPDARAALHVRRAGAVSAQQLGMLLLERARAAGARLWGGEVVGIAVDEARVAGVEV